MIVEHNLDVVACADWVIDLGPEGGERGGDVIAHGTPEEIVRTSGSHTGKYLRPVLESAHAPAPGSRARARAARER